MKTLYEEVCEPAPYKPSYGYGQPKNVCRKVPREKCDYKVFRYLFTKSVSNSIQLQNEKVCEKVPSKKCQGMSVLYHWEISLIGNLAKKVQNCVNIPEETCRDVPVPKCRSVPYKRPVYKTLMECSKCEKYDNVLVDIGYEKNCQRLEKQNCHTEYKEVNTLNFLITSL